MRPAGDVSLALLDAARVLATPEQAPTLQELAAHAQVGVDAARRTVQNMTRAGRLRKVRERRVAHRNRPVAEYAPGGQEAEHRAGHGWVDVARCVAGWAR